MPRSERDYEAAEADAVERARPSRSERVSVAKPDRRSVSDLMAQLRDELDTLGDQIGKHGSVIGLILRPEEDAPYPGEVASIRAEESGLNDYLSATVDLVQSLRIGLGGLTERVDL